MNGRAFAPHIAGMGILSMIEKSPLLEGVDGQTRERIADTLSEKQWSKRSQISGPADSAESFHLIAAGRVKIVRSNSRDGRELTVWLLGPGEGFDFVSLLDGSPHSVSAWALDPVRTLSAPMPQWREWLDDSRALRLAVHRYIGGKLRELTELSADLALHDTSARLAHLLLQQFDPNGANGNVLHDLPQRELASMIGTVRIVVSRLLSEMKRRRIVELHGGAIRAVDFKRLLAMAEADVASRHAKTDEPRSGRN